MRSLIFVVLMLAMTLAFSKSTKDKEPGGYIEVSEGGSCVLRVIQKKGMSEVVLRATECMFKDKNHMQANVGNCGKLEFSFALSVPGTESLVCTNCELLASQSASCPLRMPYPAEKWIVE